MHGNLLALRDLLGQVQPEAGKDDFVIFLGDYIDRGPDTRGCIDAILSFRSSCCARVVRLRGNHEEWMLRIEADYTRHSWLLGMEGLDTIRSYSEQAAHVIRAAMRDAGLQLYTEGATLPYDAFFDAMPADHRTFFAELELWFQTPDCICAHAGVETDVRELSDQAARSFTWGHTGFPDDYRGETTVVYGHRNNADVGADGWPRPMIIGNTVCADTISHGVLTAIRMPIVASFRVADTGCRSRR